MLEQVGVAPLGREIEEAAADNLHAVLHGREDFSRSLHHLRQVKQHALGRRRVLQHRGQQQAVAAADIDDALKASEVVGLGNGVAGHAGEGGHGRVEDLPLLGVAGVVAEQVGPQRPLRHRDALNHGLVKAAPGQPVRGRGDHDGHVPKRTGNVLPQKVGHGREREDAGLWLGVHPGRSQRSHHAMQRLLLGAHGLGEVNVVERTPGQCVRHPQLGRR